MPRKRNTAMQEAAAAAAAAAVVAAQGDTAVTLEDETDAEIAEDVLEGLRRLDQGSQKVTWYVYCDAPVEREGFVAKLRSEQLDEQLFKRLYGPGEYRLVGRTPDGSYVRGSHKTVKISGIAHEPTAQANDAVAMLREMRAADEARAAKRAEDMRTYATILATPLATLGAALISRRPAIDVAALITALRPQQSTLTEMTTALTHLRQLEGGANPSNLDVVLKLLDKLQDLPAGGDVGWLGIVRDVVREAAPHAREILAQLGQPRPPQLTSGPAFGPGIQPAPALPAAPPKPNGAPPPSNPSTAPTPTPSSPQPTSPEEDNAMKLWKLAEPWLRRKAEDLHESAAANMDVELCAEHLLESATKKFGAFVTPAELIPFLSRPDWWQFVTAFHPALEPYHAWLDDVRREILTILEEEGRAPAPDNPEGTT